MGNGKVLDLTVNSYSRAAYADTVDNLIRHAEMQLIGQEIDFDSMVAVGHSGLLVLPLLARHFKVPFFGLRKMDTSSHNSIQPYGDGILGKKWILVDDFSVTGSTITYAKDKISEVCKIHGFRSTYVGAYFYEPVGLLPGEFMYPDGKRRSVRKILVDGLPEYVNHGMYSKVHEITHLLDKSPSTVTEYVKDRYPSWDKDTIYAIATHISRSDW